MRGWFASARLWLLLGACVVFIGPVGSAWAQEPKPSPEPAAPKEFAGNEFWRARVVAVLQEQERDVADYPQLLQVVAVEILSGPETGRRVSAEYSAQAHGTQRRIATGETVVVAGSTIGGQTAYYVVEPYRVNFLTVMFLLFIGLAILLGRLRGATSLLGLAATVVVLVEFVVPRILAGENPLLVSLLGALVIGLVSIYFAHGFSRRTSVAVVATLLTLGLSAGLAVAFVALARLFGGGTEEAIYVQFGLQQTLNLQGLLLGGIILGALGVLDDITTGQAAAAAHEDVAPLSLQVAVEPRQGALPGVLHRGLVVSRAGVIEETVVGAGIDDDLVGDISPLHCGADVRDTGVDPRVFSAVHGQDGGLGLGNVLQRRVRSVVGCCGSNRGIARRQPPRHASAEAEAHRADAVFPYGGEPLQVCHAGIEHRHKLLRWGAAQDGRDLSQVRVLCRAAFV